MRRGAPAVALGAAAILATLGCRRLPGNTAAPEAGAPPAGARDVLCVERPEGCTFCKDRFSDSALLDPDEGRPWLCNPKDPEDCIEFCSRLAPECAVSWRTGPKCLAASEAEFRRALFWQETAGRPDAVLFARVVDDTGRRIEGARVSVWSQGTQVADEASGKDGSVHINLRVLPWPYTVRIARSGFGADIVEIRLGGDRSGDRQPPAPRLFHLAPDVQIRGRVTEADGTPIPSVAVQAVRTPEDAVETSAATTAEDGGFVLGGLEPRRYFLRASKFGWLSTITKAPVAAPAVRASIKMAPTGVIRGAVVDADGATEPSATVVALLSGVASAGLPIFWTADVEGKFAQDRFVVGTYYIWARRGEMLAYPPEKAEIDAEDPEVELELVLSHRGARVEGSVVPRDGFKLEDETRVILRSQSPLAFPRRAVGDVGRDGHFVVTGVSPGKFEIAVRSGSRLVAVSPKREIEVPIEPGSRVVLTEPVVVRPHLED